MFEFRVTKYDPAHRDGCGLYSRDDWTSFSEIGKKFDGVVLTVAEYERVEDAYVAAALAFMHEAGVTSLAVTGLENHAGLLLSFAEGSRVELIELGSVLRRVLREEFWLRLDGAGAFVHFGWDYYLYAGVSHPCPHAGELARRLGLFVEPFRSPYSDPGDVESGTANDCGDG